MSAISSTISIPPVKNSFCELKTTFSKEKEKSRFEKVKDLVYKVVDTVSWIFTGIRSFLDMIDPKKNLFSKEFFSIVHTTLFVDFLLFPYQVVIAVKDVLKIFVLKTVPERMEALFSLIVDTKYVVDDGASFLLFLHTVKVISDTAIKWMETFSFIKFFIDLINIEKASTSLHRLVQDRRDIKKMSSSITVEQKELREENALDALRKIKENADLATDLDISKKALDKRISELATRILVSDTKSKEKALDDVNAFMKTLATRTKVELGLTIADLVSSVVSSGGTFMGFFPPLLVASTVTVGAMGVVSFALWGSRKLCLKKDPFGPSFVAVTA